MVLGDLVEAEQEHRAPREEDRVGDAALDHVARLGRRSLHIGTAQHGHHLADGALGRADFHTLYVLGRHHLLLAVIGAGIVNEGEAEMRVLHLLGRVLAVPGVERRGSLVAVGEGERDLADRDDRESARLVSGVNVGDVGDAVPRLLALHPSALEVMDANTLDLIGRGKLDELLLRSMQLDCELIIFDQNLSPNQVRAIGEATDAKVIDRTQLILDIFAQNAHTLEGKAQVELALLRYRLPRLRRGANAKLSQQRGGVGARFGSGETKLEVDRRRIKNRISRLERELVELGHTRDLQRKGRSRSGLANVVPFQS